MKPDLYQLLFEMLRIRRVEEEIARRYPDQEMRCPVHLSIGQEAVAAGVCALLDKQDIVYSNHRSHAHYLAKGGNLDALIAELYGHAAGCSGGRGGSMHTYDYAAGFWGATPIVGGTIPIATGNAWASKLRGEDKITVVFFGDGCFEEGVMHESMNFAALHKLPIIFICENNGYSVYTQLNARQPERKIYDVAAAHGLESLFGDGNDVVAVYENTGQAVNSIRDGNGPQFLEFQTFRWLEHCGPYDDDNLGYRAEGELAEWKTRCPIKRLEEKLMQDMPRQKMQEFDEQIKTEIDTAFAGIVENQSQHLMEYVEYV